MLVRLLIIAAVALFLVLWVRAALDVYRRGDLSKGEKSAWILMMLLLPFIGLAIYVMIRPADAEIAKRARR